MLKTFNLLSGKTGVLALDDKEAVESFRELAKMHRRKANFLELRVRDPESLYEVDEVRAKIKPKRQALEEQKLVSKGMMKPKEDRKPLEADSPQLKQDVETEDSVF
jgi:hypothetical protein